ncbi:MAG: dTMP kinase [Clostridiales bacterium]|nr:dTMP kinase [Clostridiales bacterium]
MAKGLFITFEGGEGSGKSLQSRLLYDRLSHNGVDTLLIREPGSTSIGEQIRNILLDNNNTMMNAVAECYLYAASRAQLVNEVILPAVESGKVVICDRFADSSYAYQGYARGLGIETVMDINKSALGNTKADITFFLNIKPEKGLLRRRLGSDMNRLDNETLSFHNKVYEGYIKLREMFPKRFVDINGDDTVENITGEIINILYSRFGSILN